MAAAALSPHPGLYIHVPFCAKKCGYCDFPSFEGCMGLRAPYVDTLIAELDARAEGYGHPAIHTVFIGGGTPSLLQPEQMTRILDALYRNFSLAGDAEINCEANPGALTPRFLAALRNGVQEVRSTNVREPLMSSVPRDFQAAVKAEQILRSAVESELSTNALVQEDQPGHSLFSADRALFAGNEKNAHNIRSEELQLRSAPSGRELPSGDSEKTMVHTPGAAESVAVSSSQGMRSNFQDLFSREVVLQARGGAALEDGLQHVVRFLRAEGRPAASIIIDPPALGRMEIELVTTAKGIEASIKVGSEQIRQIVQDNITVLRNNLEQQGVHLGEFVVDLRDNSKGNSGRHFSSGDGRRKGSRGVIAEEQLEAGTPFFRLDLEHGLLSLVA